MIGKIRTRLTFTFIGLAVLPILLLGSFIAVKSYKAARQEAMNITRETALRVAGEIDNFIRGMVDHIEIVSTVYGLQDLTRPKQQEVLNELLAFKQTYDVVTLLDPFGSEIVQADRIRLVRRNSLGNRADKEEFLQPLRTKKIYFGPVLFREDTGEPYMTCSVPSIDPQTGNVSGVIVGDLRLKGAWDLFATLKLRPGEQVYITDDKGLVIAHQNPSIVLRGTTVKFDPEAGPNQHTHQTGLLGGHAIVGVQHIVLGNQHLHIVSEWDKRYALAQAQRIVLVIGLGTLVALLAAVLAMIPVVGNVVRPLQKLAITARKIEEGDLTLQAEVTGDDEIGELAHAFNEMTSNLHGSTTDLQIEGRERAVIQKALERELLINESLASLSKVVLSTEDTKELCDEVLMRAQTLTASEHGYVGYIDQKTGNLVLPTISSRMGKECQVKGEELRVELPPAADGSYAHLWGASLNSKKPFFSNNPSVHPASKGSPFGPVLIHHFLSIPVLLHGNLVGQIAVANALTDYQERDVEALERLGHLYALALNRADAQQEREKLLSELRQAQKMEAIGTLAGGIAHDFNNILTPILGYSEIALMGLDSEDQLYDKIQAIYQAGDRAKELINRILAFSRQHEDELSPLHMQPVLRETIKLLRSSLPTTIDIRQNIDPNCGAVISDLTQFQQIIMNLGTNASHAMEVSGGILEISLQEINLSLDDVLVKQGLPSGATACLTVSDTGCGMDKATQARIFDPYFTTKEQGKGTGMGLAMVHGIIHSHHGHITVYSEPDQGTSFKIYFPIVSTEPEGKVTAASLASTVGGTERILLVDDEEAIAAMLSTMLEQLGYHVQPITDSIEALEMFKMHPELYDLVITDQTMPHLTGGELAKELLAIRPDIPIILCTGFSASLTEEFAKKIGIREYLMKPVVIQELTDKIRDALNKA